MINIDESNKYGVESPATLSIAGATSTPPSIIFYCGSAEEVMRLDDKGMTYKGVRIEDAGEAHRLFIETMNQMNR